MTSPIPATTASAAVRYVEVGLGVVILAIAALIAVRGPWPGGAPACPPERLRTPIASPVSRLLQRGREAPTDGASLVQRILARAHAAWEGGALWVALAIGFWAGPNPSLVMFSLAAILASGAAFGAQLGAAVVFILTSLALVEIVLVSQPARADGNAGGPAPPARLGGRLPQQIVVAILTLVGLAFVAQGAGVL